MALYDELAKLGVSPPQLGVAKAIDNAGGLMGMLTWLQGNGLKAHVVNRQSKTTRPVVGSVPFGSGVVPRGSAAFSQTSFQYKRFGGDIEVDPDEIAMAGSIQDVKAKIVEDQVQELRDTMESLLFYGDATDSNYFNGLTLLFPGHTQATQNAQVKGANGDVDNGGAIGWTDIDNCVGRMPEKYFANAIWLCPRTMDPKLRDLIRTTGTQPREMMADNFGSPRLELRGRPVFPSDFLTMTETRGTSDVTGSLWLVSLGEEGVHARFPLGGTNTITLKDFDWVPGTVNNIIRCLIKLTLVVYSELSVSRICGIT